MFHETLFGTGAQSTAIGSEAQRPSTQNDSLCTDLEKLRRILLKVF